MPSLQWNKHISTSGHLCCEYPTCIIYTLYTSNVKLALNCSPSPFILPKAKTHLKICHSHSLRGKANFYTPIKQALSLDLLVNRLNLLILQILKQ